MRSLVAVLIVGSVSVSAIALDLFSAGQTEDPFQRMADVVAQTLSVGVLTLLIMAFWAMCLAAIFWWFPVRPKQQQSKGDAVP